MGDERRTTRVSRRLRAVAAAVLVLVLGAAVPGAHAVPIEDSTHLYDVDASPTNSIVVNGITLTYREGGVGTGNGGIDTSATGSSDGEWPVSTTIQTDNRRTIDENTFARGLRDYIWVSISFSEPIAVGNAFGVADLDGATTPQANFEMGAVVAFNNGTPILPTSISSGSVTIQTTRNVVSSPPGFPMPATIPAVRATGDVPNVTADDPRGRFTADFGDALVTDVVMMWFIGTGPTAQPGAQRAVLYDIGFENIPALAPIVPDPSIELDKSLGANADEDASGTVSLDDTLTYDFVVSNTGNVALDPVVLSDPLPGLSAPSCPQTSLEAGAEMTCTATYTVTQADVDAGTIENSATATGTSPDGEDVTDIDDETVTVPQSPGIGIDKSPASGDGPFAVGDELVYDLTVTNTGNVTLTDVVVSDAVLGIDGLTCGDATLAPGGSTTCQVTTTITQADIEAGEIENTATATGTPPSGEPPTDDDDARLVLEQTPAIELVKSYEIGDDADGSGSVTSGDTLTYTFTITNSGDVTLDPVTLSDDMLGLDAITCGAGALPPGGSTSCTADDEVTDADHETGTIDNTASTSGRSAAGITVTADDDLSIPVLPTPNPSIAVTKLRTSGPAAWVAGDELGYSVTVANTGNSELTGIVVTDTLIPDLSCPQTTLATGTSMVCTGTYTVTQDDVDAGQILNTATATGQPPTGPPVDGTDDHVEDADQLPAIDVVKSVTGTVAVGETLEYAFVVTNSGNVTLTDVTLTDELPGLSGIACESTAPLLPGDTVDCSAAYEVTQVDVDAGEVANTVTATATPPDGLTPPEDSDDAVVEAPPSTPTIRLVKSVELTGDADGDGETSAGDSLTYTFVITNTGLVTLSPVAYSDELLGIDSATCDDATSLAPGEDAECTVDYTVTDADVDAGVIANIATATGTPPSGQPVDDEDDAVVLLAQEPGIRLTKSVLTRDDADGSGTDTAGDVIEYAFLVLNTGNVTLTDVIVDDPTVGPVDCPVDELAAGQETTCTASYPITQADVDAGAVVNVATATGTPPGGVDQVEDDSTVTTPLTPTPGISLDKDHGDLPDPVEAGAVVDFGFLVTNTGNVTLTDITVSDPTTGPVDCPVTTLAPGEDVTCTVSYEVTQVDIDAGQIENTATAAGDPPGEADPPSDDDTDIVPLPPSPGISLEKSHADLAQPVSAGDVVEFSFLVTNTGNVTLSEVFVEDPMLGAVDCPATTLAPSDDVTCTASYELTQADIDTGSIENSATATGAPPSGLPPSDGDTDVVPLDPAPGIALVKSHADPPSPVRPGDAIEFSFLVTNTGNVTLEDIEVSDPMVGTVDCPTTTLLPAEDATCTASYEITQADVDAGVVVNEATVTGEPPGGGDPPTGTDEDEVPLASSPDITIDKSHADIPETMAAGDVVEFFFEITNTGNVTLTGVEFSDDLLGIVDEVCGGVTELAAGESTTCSAEYTLTQGDVDALGVTNTVTVSGDPPGEGDPTTDDDTDIVNVPPQVGISLVKSHAELADPVMAGDAVDFSFLVTNTGDATLTGVVVTDPMVGAVDCPDTTLSPGEDVTCTASYELTQADVDAGGIANTASVTGTPPGDLEPPGGGDTDEVPLPPAPGISLDKSHGDVPEPAAVGDVVEFSFLVSNTGNVTLTDVVVDDPLVGAVECPTTTLAPGAEVTCTASYGLTQADLDAGSVVNVATVTAEPPGGGDPPIGGDEDEVPLPPAPGISIDKTHGDVPENIAAGDVVVFSFLVTNTGNVTLADVRFSDPLLGLVDQVCGGVSELAAGETTSCSGEYTLTQGDVDALGVTNTVTVTGDPPGDGDPPSDGDTDVVNVPPLVGISVVKSHAELADPVMAGDVVEFAFLVTNTGDATLTDVVVDDPMVGPVTCPDSTLSPGEEVTCSGSYVLTQSDVDAGSIENTVSVTGTPPGDLEPPSGGDTDEVPLPPAPGISLVKTHGAVTSPVLPGDVIEFSFLVTNTGNVTLSDVVVDDPLIDVIDCPTTPLPPGEELTCAGSYEVTQADLDAGSVVNEATVTGEPPGEGEPPSGGDDDVVPLPAAPEILIDKGHLAVPAGAAAGDVVDFTFEITNTGNVTLSAVSLSDTQLGIVEQVCGDVTELAAGESTTCTAPYTLTQDDIDARVVTNTATALGTPPGEAPPVTDDDTDVVPLEPVGTEPPTSQPPTSQPPTSEPPSTEPPTTEPPTTEPPTGELPTTEPAPSPSATPPPGGLPPTGAVIGTSLAVGAVLVAAGAAMLVARRRAARE